ncbi:unnamed protein product [Heligmosomoides polygyrus]|uniref:Large ribosomal subunit protein uL10 n=1 Tax=Heligmosomoides polygyrus TaxID=6339 RepID=A0A183FUH7_HELPZ|nr:unnamed protein product [Heligmosomoides polygyrus]
MILMGKNTMIRKAIRGHLAKNPALGKLLPYIVEKVGFVFTKEDLGEIRMKLLENRRGALAKAGTLAPCDIPTKIARGTTEIRHEVHLIKEGEMVEASEDLVVLQVCDNETIHTPEVLNMTTDELRSRGVRSMLGVVAFTNVNFK